MAKFYFQVYDKSGHHRIQFRKHTIVEFDNHHENEVNHFFFYENLVGFTNQYDEKKIFIEFSNSYKIRLDFESVEKTKNVMARLLEKYEQMKNKPILFENGDIK